MRSSTFSRFLQTLSLFLCVGLVFSLWAPIPWASEPEFVIRGAGPVGLTSALELVHAGVSPDEIWVLESRSPQGPGNAWGSRNRSVVLDQVTVDQLFRLGVSVPGSPYQEAVFYVGDRPIILKNSEALRSLFFEPVFGRKFARIVRIGDLERALEERASAVGVPVRFGVRSTVEVGSTGAARVRLQDSTEALEPRVLLATDGRASDTRTALGIGFESVPIGINPTYIGSDFATDRSRNVGQAMVFLDERMKVLGYGFTHSKGGSIGVRVEPDASDLEKRQALDAIARRMGVEPSSLQGVYPYTGRLEQAARIQSGNTYIIGDAARTTDPASGNGLNTGLRDASDLGQLVREERAGLAGAETRFLDRVRENSRYTFRGSVQFQRLPVWAQERLGSFASLARYSQSEVLNTAAQMTPAGLSRAGGQLLRWAGAKAGMPLSQDDPTLNLSIHGSKMTPPCERPFFTRALEKIRSNDGSR